MKKTVRVRLTEADIADKGHRLAEVMEEIEKAEREAKEESSRGQGGQPHGRPRPAPGCRRGEAGLTARWPITHNVVHESHASP